VPILRQLGIITARNFFAAVLIIVVGDRALADDCSDVLSPALLNRSVNQRSTSFAEATRNWMCAASLNEVNRYSSSSDSSSGGGGFNLFGYFGIGAEGASASSVTEGQFEAWKQQNCSQNDYSMNRSAFEFFAQQAVAPAAIEAWRACKLRQQALSCWISPHGTGNQIEFHYNWNGNAVDVPAVKDFDVRQGVSTPQLLKKSGDKIYIGEATEIINRNPTLDTQIRLNIVLSERFAYSCGAYIPMTPPPITTAQIRGRWCFGNALDRYIGIQWQDWLDSGPDTIQIADAHCSSPTMRAAGTAGQICSQIAQSLMANPMSFRPLSSNEFEIWQYLLGPVGTNDRQWIRYRLVTPSQLVILGQGSLGDWSGGSYQRRDEQFIQFKRCGDLPSHGIPIPPNDLPDN
jgi:hypothetical protein